MLTNVSHGVTQDNAMESLPPALGGLSALRHLDLRRNPITLGATGRSLRRCAAALSELLPRLPALAALRAVPQAMVTRPDGTQMSRPVRGLASSRLGWLFEQLAAARPTLKVCDTHA